MNRRLMLGVLNGLVSGGSSGVQISDQTILDSRVQGLEASASYSLLSNGLAYRSKSTTGPQVIPGQWTSPTAALGDDYEVRAQVVESFPPNGVSGAALDTWLTLSVSRTWSVIVGPGVEEKYVTLFVAIRRADNQQLVSTAYIYLNAITFDGAIPP